MKDVCDGERNFCQIVLAKIVGVAALRQDLCGDEMAKIQPPVCAGFISGYLKHAGLAGKAKALMELLEEDPYRTPPPYEKLSGDLRGLYSRRINIQHRLVYEINETDHVISVYRMWTHYE